MHVYLLARPTLDNNQIPVAGLRSFSDALSSAGCSVIPDIRPAAGPLRHHAVDSAGEGLRRLSRFNRPAIIHAFGTVAVEAALQWRPEGTRLVATFDEGPRNLQAELDLARSVDAVLSLSESEDAEWRRLGVTTLSFGGVPALPIVPMADSTRLPGPGRRVITSSTEEALESLIAALPGWRDVDIVVLGQPRQQRWREVARHAAALGVADRIRLVTDPDEARGVWRDAAVFVAGPECARHGVHALWAAVHGVPVVAWASGAHLDAILPGVTGRLVPASRGVQGLAEAVTQLLADPVAARALGEAARVRAAALHDPEHGGPRVLALFESLLTPARAVPAHVPAPRLPAARYEMVLEHLPYAIQLAKRYAGRGQSLDDLVQVASLGLVHAANRFDPAQGKEFYSFATPTILGELRKHFRDHAWAVRVPRTLQETSIQVQRAAEERASAGLSTTPASIAAELGLVEEEVLQAQQVHLEARSLHSLDMPVGERGDEYVSDIIGEADPAYDLIDKAGAVHSALRQLPDREREIVLLRYYGDRTQAEIAEMLGISQVQVSRLLSRTLAAIRDHVLLEEPLPASRRSHLRVVSQS